MVSLHKHDDVITCMYDKSLLTSTQVFTMMTTMYNELCINHTDNTVADGSKL